MIFTLSTAHVSYKKVPSYEAQIAGVIGSHPCTAFTLRFLDLKFPARTRSVKQAEEELAGFLNGEELALFRALDQTLDRDTWRPHKTIDLHITTKTLPLLNEMGFFGHLIWLLQLVFPENFTSNVFGKHLEIFKPSMKNSHMLGISEQRSPSL